MIDVDYLSDREASLQLVKRINKYWRKHFPEYPGFKAYIEPEIIGKRKVLTIRSNIKQRSRP